MDCEEARIEISRRLDGESLPDRQAPLDRHLEGCVECAAFARQCERLQALIRTQAATEDWEARSLGALEAVRAARGGEEPRRRRAVRPALTALTAAACVVVGIALIRQHVLVGRLSGGERRLRAEASASQPRPGELAVLAAGARPPSAQAVQEQVQAFAELADYFQDGLRWMAQAGSEVRLGVTSDYAAAEPGPAPRVLLVELSLVFLSGSDGPTAVASPSVLIRPGEQADFRFAASDGGRPAREISYRVEAGGAGEPAVMVRVAAWVDGAEPVHLQGVVDSGLPAPVAFSRHSAGAFMLQGAVRALPPAAPETGDPT